MGGMDACPSTSGGVLPVPPPTPSAAAQRAWRAMDVCAWVWGTGRGGLTTCPQNFGRRCAGVALWAGRSTSCGLHPPIVRGRSFSYSCPPTGPAEHWAGRRYPPYPPHLATSPTALSGQTDKLCRIPEGQRYSRGVATARAHQVVAWG